MSIENKQLIPEEVIQYQLAYDRLDIYKVFDLINFTPHAGQKLIIDAVQDRHINFTVIACGRRLGKSFVVGAIATSRLLLPNAKIVLMSKSFKNASNLFKEVYKFLKLTGVKITSQNKTNLSFTLENGSEFTSISERNVESILGASTSTLIVDEAAILDQEGLENSVEQLITPSLASYGVREDGSQYGEIILLSSPRRARGYFYNKFKDGKRSKEGHASIQLPTSMNPYIPKAFLDKKKKELPPEIFNTEYLGQFDDASGNVAFYAFRYNNNTFKPSEVDLQMVKESKAIVGLDFGYTDSSSQVYAYLEPLTGKYYILSEYLKNKLGIEEHSIEFKKNENKYPPRDIIRFSDPSAPIVMATLASSFGYFSYPGLNPIRDSIECLNTLFHQGKILISEDCTFLIDTIEQLEWKDTEGGKDPFKKLPSYLGHGDLVAALRYGIYSHYKIHVESSFDIIEINNE